MQTFGYDWNDAGLQLIHEPWRSLWRYLLAKWTAKKAPTNVLKSSRPHTPKGSVWKGNPLILGKSRLVKYYTGQSSLEGGGPLGRALGEILSFGQINCRGCKGLCWFTGEGCGEGTKGLLRFPVCSVWPNMVGSQKKSNSILDDTIDGSEIRRSPLEVDSLSLILPEFYTSKRWWFEISDCNQNNICRVQPWFPNPPLRGKWAYRNMWLSKRTFDWIIVSFPEMGQLVGLRWLNHVNGSAYVGKQRNDHGKSEWSWYLS